MPDNTAVDQSGDCVTGTGIYTVDCYRGIQYYCTVVLYCTALGIVQYSTKVQ